MTGDHKGLSSDEEGTRPGSPEVRREIADLLDEMHDKHQGLLSEKDNLEKALKRAKSQLALMGDKTPKASVRGGAKHDPTLDQVKRDPAEDFTVFLKLLSEKTDGTIDERNKRRKQSQDVSLDEYLFPSRVRKQVSSIGNIQWLLCVGRGVCYYSVYPFIACVGVGVGVSAFA